MFLPILIIFFILFSLLILKLIIQKFNNKKVVNKKVVNKKVYPVIKSKSILSDEVVLSKKYPNFINEELFYLLENKDLNGEEFTIEERNFLVENEWSNLVLTIPK